LNHPGRRNSLDSLIRINSLYFVGVVETNKEVFQQGFLESLDGPSKFYWHVRGGRGLLLGIREDWGVSSSVSSLEFSLNCVVQNKIDGFVWKLVVVYGAPYDDKKADFIDELHLIFLGWQGPIMVGGILILLGFAEIRIMVRLIKDLRTALMIGSTNRAWLSSILAIRNTLGQITNVTL
jgi:hypothetical protein